MATDTRPTSLTAVHNYNLRNQGWPISFALADQEDGDATIVGDPVTHTFQKVGYYPSNADIIHASLLSAGNEPESIGSYSPWSLKKNYFGNTPAPKGHFILNAFDRNRITVTGIAAIYDPDRDKDTDRPVAVEFFAGRVFYFMPGGRVLYSQQLTDITKIGKCYQENDPTADAINELLATDGGIIDIYEIGEILDATVMDRELVVFADNGVWSISGGQSSAFSASDNEVRKITHMGAIGKETVVLSEDVIFYFGRGGIYRISRNQYTGLLESANISENTVQTFYLDLREITRQNASGYYDQASRKIIWLYNDDTDYDGVNFRRKYNKALILDAVSGAFSKYSFDTDTTSPFISGMIRKDSIGAIDMVAGIVVGTDTVVEGADTIIHTTTTPSFGEVKLKLLTFVPTDTDEYSFTLSEFKNRSFLDWVTFTQGIDYDSYILTGQDILGDPIVMKFGNWLYSFFEKTETAYVDETDYDYPSSCFYQVRWHWSDLASSGKWSTPEQIYKFQRPYISDDSTDFNYGFEILESRSNLRGNGRAISIKFYSETGKDFRLLGWAIPFTGVTGV